MPHFMIVLILYINLFNLSWIIKCLLFEEMDPLIVQNVSRQKSDAERKVRYVRCTTPSLQLPRNLEIDHLLGIVRDQR